jgi:hypothetical protein
MYRTSIQHYSLHEAWPTSTQSESKVVGQRPFSWCFSFPCSLARNRAAGVTSLACRPCAHLASLDSVERGYFLTPQTLFYQA